MSQSGSLNNNGGGGGSGIKTINGDTGSITGSTVTIFSNNSARNSGSSIAFVNAGTVSTFNTTDANSNVFIGKVSGKTSLTGASNTALGVETLTNVTTSSVNVAIGRAALGSLTGPVGGAGANTAVGWQAGVALLTGTDNIFLGAQAGLNYAGAETGNIIIDNAGVLGESNVTRIGKQSGGGAQTACFIAGISGVTVAASSPVAIDANGQLSDLGFGTAAQVLTSNGAGVSPTWQAAGGGGFTPVNWSVQLSTNQANVTGNNTQYKIPYDTVLFDSASRYDIPTSTYTIPTTGIYNITRQDFLFGGTAASTLYFGWYSINASAFPGTRVIDMNSATLGLAVNGEFIYSTCSVFSLTAGDTISVFVDVIGGAGNDVGVGGTYSIFSGYRVG